MIIQTRKPTHPGEILREEFMQDYNLSVAELANNLCVTRQSINALVHERRSVSPSMALRLGKFFGTTARYWLTLQMNYDIWSTLQSDEETYNSITTVGEVQALQA
jgi:antitoxin HigA-1